nr:MAG TPA_asm: hypothetical protein [Caudoviricetes sp.]
MPAFLFVNEGEPFRKRRQYDGATKRFAESEHLLMTLT